MPHHSRLDKIVIDVTPADHDRELGFWQAALGVSMKRNDRWPEYHGARLPGHDVVLLTQRLGDGPSRLHLDVHTDNVEAEVARLEKLGARRVQQVHSWWIMEDPAGLPFCVIPSPPGALDENNAQRWD